MNWIVLQVWWVRAWIAHKIYPDHYDNYQSILADLRDIHNMMHEIPEINQISEWVLGKDWVKTSKNESVKQLYPTYGKFQSLAHFRDVLFNEYERKTKDRK